MVGLIIIIDLGEEAELTKLLKAMQREVRGAWVCPTAGGRTITFLIAAGRYTIAVAEGFAQSAGNPGWIRSSCATFGLEKVSLPGVPVELLRERGVKSISFSEWRSAPENGTNTGYPLRRSPRTVFFMLSCKINSVDRMGMGLNEECPAPYSFVLKRNQRYCSEVGGARKSMAGQQGQRQEHPTPS